MKKIKNVMPKNRFHGVCELCGKKIGLDESYCYVDENNYAITNNSPYLCLDCYKKKYGRG